MSGHSGAPGSSSSRARTTAGLPGDQAARARALPSQPTCQYAGRHDGPLRKNS